MSGVCAHRRMRTTRLAPSPTGALHLGNARTFALTWLAARAEGARVLLRIEDIESPRKKPWAQEQALEDLAWLGLDWDGEVVVQTARLAAYAAALDRLVAAGHVYACTCSRRDVEAAQAAPHAEDDLRYPGTCRGRWKNPAEAFAASGRPVALRFLTPSRPIAFDDEVRGRVVLDPAQSGGDFVVARWSPGRVVPGYQLAVVADDAWQGVDWVIRGDDLVTSTPRQMILQEALVLPTPTYAHLPMVIGADGRRLAKRHGDTRIAAYREAGIPASRIRAWIAASAHLDAAAFEQPAASGFTVASVPHEPVVVPRHRAEGGPPAI